MIRKKHKKHIRDFKKAILQYVKFNKKNIASTFNPKKIEGDMDKALVDTNWVHVDRYSPISYNYEIIHEFDCKAYKGKLKAYVYTTVGDQEIENVMVQVE